MCVHSSLGRITMLVTRIMLSIILIAAVEISQTWIDVSYYRKLIVLCAIGPSMQRRDPKMSQNVLFELNKS